MNIEATIPPENRVIPSQEVFTAARKYSRFHTCLWCGKDFITPVTTHGVYCSRTCSNEVATKKYRTGLRAKCQPKSRPWDGGKRPDITGSNHPMFGRKHTKESREKISLGTKEAWDSGVVYTEEYLKNQGLAQEKAAKIRPNYRGGVSPERVRIRSNGLYFRWKKAVHERDGYRCQSCSSTDGPFHAHHKIKFSTILNNHGITEYEQATACEELWDVSNGQTLCKKCHGEIHNIKFLR